VSARSDKVVVSLFSGSLGLDLGLERAGFRIAVAVESNRFAAETIRRNRPDIKVIDRDIREVSADEILAAAKLSRGQVAVVTGGPSCQSFSTAGGRESLGDPRGGLFREFLRIVRGVEPRFFVMENVRGILSAAVRHRPLAERGPGFPPLDEDELLGSALKVVVRSLGRVGYRVVFDLVNAASYGVPQSRHRVVFLGSRDGEDVRIPAATHSEGIWRTLRDAIGDLDDLSPEFTKLPSGKAKYLRLIPEGGNWRDLPVRLQKKALGRAYDSWGGRSGFFRRLAWDAPSPALTTKPDSKATVLCHPEELRPLSVREYARIQQFPDDWTFAGGTPQKYKMIGNAVPLGLGEAIGRALVRTMRRAPRGPKAPLPAGVECAEKLAERLAKRPRIIMNPPRMRRQKGLNAAKRWVAASLGGEGGPTSKHRVDRKKVIPTKKASLPTRRTLPPITVRGRAAAARLTRIGGKGPRPQPNRTSRKAKK